MFRELQRKNKEILKDECIELLINEKRGVLSVIGDEGFPYGMPMNHYYNHDDGCIYFHCGKKGHRIDALNKCDKASFCVYDSGVNTENTWALDIKSVIVFGNVEIITHEKIVSDITRKLSLKFTSDKEYIDDEIKNHLKNTVLLKLVPQHICGKLVHEA